MSKHNGSKKKTLHLYSHYFALSLASVHVPCLQISDSLLELNA